MLERKVDHAVRRGGGRAQPVEIVKRAAMHGRTGRGDGNSRGVRAREPDDLMPEARRLAERLAAQPGPAIRGTKQILSMHLGRALAGAVQAGFAAEEISMLSAEHQQRISALADQEELRRRRG